MILVRRAAGAGVCYLMMRFFFPRPLLVPVMAIAAAGCLAWCVTPFRVRLDRAGGAVAITVGFWTRHVPLTRIKRVDQVLRLGAEITVTDGWGFRFGPFRKRRLLERLLRIRTGFEGMELAITQAAAEARAAGPGHPADPASRLGPIGACAVLAGGLFSLAVAALVRAQADGWLVHAVAVLLRIMYGLGGVVCVLAGLFVLARCWRDWRVSGRGRAGGAGRARPGWPGRPPR